MKIQLKRSNVTEGEGFAKKPTNTQMEYGELAVNYGAADPAIFMKDSNDNIIRISGREVPTDTTPPENPLPGNFWYNPEDGRLYIYYKDIDSAQWVDASPDDWKPQELPDITDPSQQPGTLDDRYVNLTGDTMTGNLLVGSDITLNESSGKITTAATQDTDTGNTLVTKNYVDNNVLTGDFLSLKADAGNQVVLSPDDTSFTGNVGIGTDSPDTTLELYNSDPRLTITDSDEPSRSTQLRNTTGNTYLTQIGSGNIIFGIPSEAMRIDSSGRLLVSVSTARSNIKSVTTSVTPICQIESTGSSAALSVTRNVSNANAGTIYIAKTRGTTNGDNVIVFNNDKLGSLSFNGADGTNLLNAARIDCEVDGTPGADDMPGRLVFFTTADGANSPTEKMVIKSTGNVGIGTDSPQAKLDVGGTILTETIVYTTNQDQPYLIAGTTSYTGATTNWGTHGFQHRLKSNASGTGRVTIDTHNGEAFCVNNLGNVGIGTVDPAGVLNVRTNTAVQPSLTYDSENILNLDYGTVQLAVGIDSSSPFGSYLQSRDNSNGARSLNLNPAGGNVGIGTDSPQNKLHLVDNSSTGIRAQSENTQSTDTNKALHVSNGDTTDTFNVSYKGQGYFAGKVGIGTDNPSDKLEVNGNLRFTSAGQGINFPGHAAGNLLDDYEEGTFTPTFGGTVTNPTGTYNTNSGGLYRKIGNVVFVQLRMRFDCTSIGEGNLVIRGMPFTAVNSLTRGCVSMGSLTNFNSSATNGVPRSGILTNNTTVITMTILELSTGLTKTCGVDALTLNGGGGTATTSNNIELNITYMTD